MVQSINYNYYSINMLLYANALQSIDGRPIAYFNVNME